MTDNSTMEPLFPSLWLHEQPPQPQPPQPPQESVETSLKNLMASHKRVRKLEKQLAAAREERAERLRLLLDTPEELGQAPTMYALAKVLGMSKQAVAKIRQGSGDPLRTRNT